MKIKLWNKNNHDRGIRYLEKYSETSMFLLQNIEELGCRLGDHQNSGNFYIVTLNDEIKGIFVLTKRGNILFQIENEVPSKLILDYLKKTERIKILGILGEDTRAQEFWGLILENDFELSESFSSSEKLYVLNPNQADFPDVVGAKQFDKEKLDVYLKYTEQFYIDQGLPDGQTKEQHIERFNYKIEQKYIWCLENDNEVLSMCSLNGKFKSTVQVGGVFTPDIYRSRGYSKKCMSKLIHDCIHIHKTKKVILFTALKNIPAQKVYEKLGFKEVGYYGMYFGDVKMR